MGSALLTFVSLEDPYLRSSVAGEDQPGPILLLAAARRFDSVVLLATPQAARNAKETAKALAARSPDTRVAVADLPIHNPRDLGLLVESARNTFQSCHAGDPEMDWFANLGSGTQEMRMAWTVIGHEPRSRLRLLRLYWPNYPSVRHPVVREVERVRPEAAVEPMALFALRQRTGAAESIELFSPPEPANELEVAFAELRIVVRSAVLQDAAEKAALLAPHDVPVLLLGETGTGKEVFAQLLHRLSRRNRGPFIVANCAAMPVELAESLLFGARKGAFSGAVRDIKGKFEEADRGTLFLDEVGELPAALQSKLLRVLQDGIVEPLGEPKGVKRTVRIIAATNRDLPSDIAAGRFRKDLYHRLSVAEIRLPPLRQRVSEISPLALEFLGRVNAGFAATPRQLTRAALERLENHSWPGNVRELANVIERSVLLSRRDRIDAADLIIQEPVPQPDRFAGLPEPKAGFVLEEYISDVRHQLILRAVEMAQGNLAEAALLLGMTRQALSKHYRERGN